jgi:hypothetical protein
MKAAVTSKIPFARRKNAITAAIVVKAACGCTSAQIPAITKSTARTLCAIFQPVVETAIETNSLAAAVSAITPNKNEIA